MASSLGAPWGADQKDAAQLAWLLLATGKAPQAALSEIGQAVEGYAAARAIHSVAAHAGVEMPLCEMVYRVLYEQLSAKDAVRALMSRPVRSELE